MHRDCAVHQHCSGDRVQPAALLLGASGPLDRRPVLVDATYRDDPNYATVSTPCNDTSETFTVGPPTPTIATVATIPGGRAAPRPTRQA